MRPAAALLAQLHTTALQQPRAHPRRAKHRAGRHTMSTRQRSGVPGESGTCMRRPGARQRHRAHPRTAASTSVPLPPPRAASLPSGVRQLTLRALCNATRRDVRCKNRCFCSHTGPGVPCRRRRRAPLLWSRRAHRASEHLGAVPLILLHSVSRAGCGRVTSYSHPGARRQHTAGTRQAALSRRTFPRSSRALAPARQGSAGAQAPEEGSCDCFMVRRTCTQPHAQNTCHYEIAGS